MSDNDEGNCDSSAPKLSIMERIAAGANSAGENLDAALADLRLAADTLAIDHDTCEQLDSELEYWEAAVQAINDALDADGFKLAVPLVDSAKHAGNSADYDQNSNDGDKLLHKLDEQSALIAELQKQIGQLSQLATMSADSTDAPRTGDPYLNRVLVAADSGGNLKFPIDKNIMTIGREALNDIPIRSRYISRYHARIVSDQNGAVIEDLDSRNGISVNSQRVRRQQLRSGDLISVGRTQLKFIDLTDSESGEGLA